MSCLIYLTLEGDQQGLISSGCSTLDSIGNRYQSGHENQIQVLGLNHTITREDNISHHPVQLIKPIDKSSPLLGMSIASNEKIKASFYFYRTNIAGQLEVFYELKLSDYRNEIGEITEIQQVSLFNLIYQKYITRAWLNYNEIIRDVKNKPSWEDLHPTIKDVLIDITYQGYRGETAMIAATHNNIDYFIEYIKNNRELARGELARGRINYLNDNRGN